MIGRRTALTGSLAALGLGRSPDEAIAQDSSDVHALLVGIDVYRLSPLRGCVNDLRLLERTLRPRVSTLATLVNTEATRARFMEAYATVTGRCRSGDHFLLSFSGHGDRKPEAIAGSEEDGLDDFIIFQPFHPTQAPEEILLDNEIAQLFAELGRRHVTVLFLADCCHAGTMTRRVEPAAARQQAVRTLNGAYPVSQLMTALAAAPPPPPDPPRGSQARVHLFAASLETLPVPEITFDGRRHGAMSVAFARAVEGSAAQGSGVLVRDLAERTLGAVRALGDGRQIPNIVLGELGNDVLFKESGSAAQAPYGEVAPAETPVRLRVEEMPDAEGIAALGRLAQAVQVGPEQEADLIWLPGQLRVVSGLGDIIAYDVGPSDLASAVDRARSLRRLQALVARQPLELRIERLDGATRGLSRAGRARADNATHTPGTPLRIIGRASWSAFLHIFNIAGDGMVQFLHPRPGEIMQVRSGQPFGLDDIRVQEPFGADHAVALLLLRPDAPLLDTLRRLHGTRQPMAATSAVERALGPSGWQIGLVGIFTRPG